VRDGHSAFTWTHATFTYRKRAQPASTGINYGQVVRFL
jgi:hypothetical protein